MDEAIDFNNWREQFTGSGDAEKDAAFQEVLADVEAACYGTPEEREAIIRKWEGQHDVFQPEREGGHRVCEAGGHPGAPVIGATRQDRAGSAVGGRPGATAPAG